MTLYDIVYQRRLRVLANTGETGNVAVTCRTFGISRTTFYRWRSRATAYGPEALLPKGRRRPQAPSATPTPVGTQLLAEAVVRPTLGARPLADWIGGRVFALSKTCVQDCLVSGHDSHLSRDMVHTSIGEVACVAVHGHENVPTGGRITVPAGGQLKVPTPR